MWIGISIRLVAHFVFSTLDLQVEQRLRSFLWIAIAGRDVKDFDGSRQWLSWGEGWTLNRKPLCQAFLSLVTARGI